MRGSRAALIKVEDELHHTSGLLAIAVAETARLRRALDALHVGVVLVDDTGDSQVRNAAAHDFGGHADVLVGRAVAQHLATAVQGTASEQKVDLFGPPRRSLVVRATPLAGGGALATIEDVSERIRLEAVRTDFVANISHELKTPIGGLAVLAEALTDSDDPAVIHRLAERIVTEAHRASRTIDDLLELSRIELDGDAQPQLMSVRIVIDESIGRAQLLAEARRVTVTVDEERGLMVSGDARQLISAIANLLDNAIKYSDEGSDVVVSAREVDGWVELAVKDHGIGIPAQDLERVFERFYRVDRARSRHTGGTGLGLAIVRHVATNHGGSVSATSHEGEGSVFALRVRATTTGEP